MSSSSELRNPSCPCLKLPKQLLRVVQPSAANLLLAAVTFGLDQNLAALFLFDALLDATF